MSFLLDTNICSEHIRRPSGLSHRFVQHSGGLYTAAIVLAELYTWAYRRTDTGRLLSIIESDLLADVVVLDFDRSAALCFGQLHAELLANGNVIDRVDMMLAAVALAHNLTLVTHNLKDFARIPRLRVIDWLE